jgi:DnaK suppressor protein
MPNVAEIEEFQNRLRQERIALEKEDALGAEDRGTVQLDQQSVGRLSRMDALQRQAMAEATQRRRQTRRRRIDAALQRIEDGEFGFCQDCGEEIPLARLNLDPTVLVCVSCAQG